MTETYGLEKRGIKTSGKIYRNQPVAILMEHALAAGEGFLAANGALVTRTGERTGRSPYDRYTVKEPSTEGDIWWGKVNVPATPEKFNEMWALAVEYQKDRDLYVFDGHSGADERYELPVRIVSDKAWHGLFGQTLFRRPSPEKLAAFKPEDAYTVFDASDLKIKDFEERGVRSEVFISLDIAGKRVVIIGSGYAGEIKKSIFTIMNFILPNKGVCPMHCSANEGADGDSALFFGLSGTGKTTLSADPNRRLIGDDQTGWSDDGVFNFEGGCYAKVINLDPELEPQIYDAIRFGSVLENVIVDEETREVDYSAADITENTRATYPVEYIPRCIVEGVGDHPGNVFFLAADAFGILPPISKLTRELAMYHFLSGYTAKLAGTEAGIDEPQATFSACFGAPFMPRHPTVYAELLGERLVKHDTSCWLVNTGWSGGPYGVGSRMRIDITRALLTGALEGKLDKVKFTPDPVFNVLVPEECPGVPKEVLTSRNTWDDKNAYDAKAKELAGMFVENFKAYEDMAADEVRAVAPRD
jgi:phosphoenolpyruvate carboxykinase (ATP)